MSARTRRLLVLGIAIMANTALADDLPDFDALWNYGEPAATEAAFREILPQAEGTGNAEYHVQLLTQIARTHSLRQQFDRAHALLDQVEQMLSDETPVARVRYLLERGRTFNSSQQVDRARPLFLEAWERGREVGADGFAVDAAHMMAIVERADESLAWNQRALALAESSADERARRWRGSLLNNIGWTHHDAGDFEAALDAFERALEARRERGEEGPIRVARWCIARALRSLGRHDEALEMQRALESEYAELGEGDGYVQEELGELLLLLDRPDEARPHFARAHALLSEDVWLARDEPERLERLRRLGEGGEPPEQ